MQESINLNGKVALVTGSGRGLGKAYALMLAQAGCDVVIHDIDDKAPGKFGESSSGEAVADEVKALGRRSAFYTADLTRAEEVEQLVGKVIRDFGKLDILVNNAGGDIGARTPRPMPNDALDIDIEDIRSVVDRNLLTTMYMCKFAGLHMRERGNGKIINVGSVAGHIKVPNGIIYAAAKAAISHYTTCLSLQMKPHGVNVNCISPAPTITGRFLATRDFKEDPDKSRLEKVAMPEDMARIVLFLSSSLSDYLTGETIVC